MCAVDLGISPASLWQKRNAVDSIVECDGFWGALAKFALPVTVGLSVVSADARAGCNWSTTRFFPLKNDKVSAHGTVDTAGCTQKFSGDKNLRLVTAIIASNPNNGTLTQTDPFTFSYIPNTNFKGADSYSIKVCATSSRGAGCSTISYKVDVIGATAESRVHDCLVEVNKRYVNVGQKEGQTAWVYGRVYDSYLREMEMCKSLEK
jgi:Bacterial Ig domain